MNTNETETQTWRDLLRARPHLQEVIARRESAASWVRTFQPSILPGLLQTREYATRVFQMFQVPYAAADLEAAVAWRLERKAALRRGDVEFSFVVTEAALRWRPAPWPLLAEQLDGIRQLTRAIDTVQVSVIPADVGAVTAIPHGFVLYTTDGVDSVSVENIHAAVEVTDPADVRLYDDQWDKLHQMALHGLDAREFIAGLADEFRRAGT